MTTTVAIGGSPSAASHDVERGPAASSAAKALAILDVFSGPRAVLGVTELAREIGVPKSTAHRLLCIMIDSGYVHKVSGRYALTERVFELGNRVASVSIRSTGLRQQAMPFLLSLFVSTRETIHLGTLAGTDVLYLEKLFGQTGAPCPTTVGARRPAHATALGKAMLAYSSDEVLERCLSGPLRRFTGNTVSDPQRLQAALDSTRSAGFASDHGEIQNDVFCIAAPIRDLWSGEAIAAVSICTRTTRNLESRYGQLLLETARELSRIALVGSQRAG